MRFSQSFKIRDGYIFSNMALEELREEYKNHFTDIFKPITKDNGTEFSRRSDLEEHGIYVYFPVHIHLGKDRRLNTITAFSPGIFS